MTNGLRRGRGNGDAPAPTSWLPDLSAPALTVAPKLLGLTLGRGDRSGTIVEVEAYGGVDDPASHAANGPTKRNASMFGPPGGLYVYLIYGMHLCANIVCGPEGDGGAVLVRAIEPLSGIEAMRRSRPKAKRDIDLTNGPGKLCAALGVEIDDDGTDLMAPGPRPTGVSLSAPAVDARAASLAVMCGPRVGITKATTRKWRFALSSNFVSRPHVGLEPHRPAGGS